MTRRRSRGAGCPGPLALTADWLTDPEYYSTIQTGRRRRRRPRRRGRARPVRDPHVVLRPARDGRLGALSARGYPAFQGGHSGASGYQNAFGAFNTVAAFDRTSPRVSLGARRLDAGERVERQGPDEPGIDADGPAERDPAFAGCAEPPNPGSPPSYQSCARPQHRVEPGGPADRQHWGADQQLRRGSTGRR